MCFDGCSSICERLARNDPTLTILNLNHQCMGNDGAKALARALTNNTVVVVIFLQHNLLGPSAVSALAAALQWHPRLSHLYLDYNRLGDAACPALAQLMTSCPALQVLKLTDNAIGWPGMQTLATALRRQPNLPLQYLSLQNNVLGRRGMHILCEALATNTSLQWLDVRCNAVPPKHTAAVTAAWIRVLSHGSNQTLTHLELWEADEGNNSNNHMAELTFWLQWNRAGRRSLRHYDSTAVPTTYLLGHAAAASPAVLMATLLARPDLVLRHSSCSC